MAQEKWKLIGRAYGRSYDEALVFIEKKEIRVPPEVVEEHLKIALAYNPGLDQEKHRKLVETVEHAYFETKDGIEVIVQPRYVGSKLGSDDDGKGNTICHFSYNSAFTALANYNEKEKTIKVHQHN